MPSPVTEKHSQAEVRERQEKISLGSLEEVSREGEFRIQQAWDKAENEASPKDEGYPNDIQVAVQKNHILFFGGRDVVITGPH